MGDFNDMNASEGDKPHFRNTKPRPTWMTAAQNITDMTGISLTPNSPSIDPFNPAMRSFIEHQPEQNQPSLIHSTTELSDYKKKKSR